MVSFHWIGQCQCPIPKKGNAKDYSNYCTIATVLVSCAENPSGWASAIVN